MGGKIMKKTLKLIALIGALALMATSAAACNMLPINLQNSGEASQTASSVVEESSKESSEESSQESSEESSEIQESSEQESSVLESQVESSIEESSSSSTESEASDTSVQESSTAAAAPSGVYSSLTEMYNDPSMKSTFDKTAESFSNDMMDVKILIENNTQFVYDFKYKVDTSSISADYLKNALNSASSTYDGIADQLKSLTNDKSVSVIVRYVGNDGNTIAEKEYFGS